MTISKPVASNCETWLPPAHTVPAAYETLPPAPVDWTTLPAYPTPKPAASGYDRDLKIGTVLLIVSWLVFPIVFGPGAAYCGYRSHKAGNPAGMFFAIGSIVLTIINIMIVLTMVLPLLLN